MDRQNWKKFFSYYKPYRKLFWSDMFFATVAAAVTLIIPLIVRYITTHVIYWDAKTALHTILSLVILMLFLVILEFYSNYFITNYGHMMGARMEYDMRTEIFGHYQKLPFSFFDNQKVGQLMSRVTNDLFEISELFHHGPEDIVISIIKLIGSFSILLFINWRLALAAFALVPLMLIYAYYFNIKMKRIFVKNRARIADINAQIEDNLSGIRVVKSFANEEIEMGKFKIGNDNFLESKKENYKYMALYNSGLTAFTTLITVLVLAVSAVFITKNMINVTDLVTFLLYINNFTEPVKKLINFTEQFQNGMSGYTRFLEMLSIQPDITDAPGAVVLKQAKGDILFENVSFHYEDHSEMVLSGLNLHVSPGEYVALVGTSGVGKSTLCSLIPRFYDVSEGRILLDGTDIRNFTLKSLRENIGIVQQDVYLFAGSVMDNIRYGRLDATDEECIAAAKLANADDFITRLPEGYNTVITGNGANLSQGQRQLLSIARAAVADPPVMILDEATSSIDTRTEAIVQAGMDNLMKGRTVFVIAHRLSTIRNADSVIVLDHGRIIERGTHDELIAMHGTYYQLYTGATELE